MARTTFVSGDVITSTVANEWFQRSSGDVVTADLAVQKATPAIKLQGSEASGVEVWVRENAGWLEFTDSAGNVLGAFHPTRKTFKLVNQAADPTGTTQGEICLVGGALKANLAGSGLKKMASIDDVTALAVAL